MARPNLRATDRSYFHEREKSRYMQRFLVARQRNDDPAEGGTINLWADRNYGCTVDQPTNRLNFRFAEPRRIRIPSTLLSIERAQTKRSVRQSRANYGVIPAEKLSRLMRFLGGNGTFWRLDVHGSVFQQVPTRDSTIISHRDLRNLPQNLRVSARRGAFLFPATKRTIHFSRLTRNTRPAFGCSKKLDRVIERTARCSKTIDYWKNQMLVNVCFSRTFQY